MKKANTQYVLVKGFEVLGPFETLELAQRFRSEHRDTLDGHVAVRIRDADKERVMQITREELYREILPHFEGEGELVLDLPRGWPTTEVDNGWTIYHYGIRWVETPNRLNVVTYGPDPIIVDGTIIHHRTEQYVCWAC